MGEVKHTPGPWVATSRKNDTGEWNIDGPEGADDGGWAIAIVMGGAGMEDPNGRSDENARLIAAAPDLLAALKLVVTRCGPNATDGAIAHAAIAKAEGTK